MRQQAGLGSPQNCRRTSVRLLANSDCRFNRRSEFAIGAEVVQRTQPLAMHESMIGAPAFAMILT